jgi:hypothetical protein
MEGLVARSTAYSVLKFALQNIQAIVLTTVWHCEAVGDLSNLSDTESLAEAKDS